MPAMFRKHFHLCFSKITCLPTSLSSPGPRDEEDDDYDYDYDYEFKNNNNPDLTPAVLGSPPSPSTVDAFSSSSLSTSSEEEEKDLLSAIFASQRLILSSPGNSNSILHSEPASRRLTKLVGVGLGLGLGLGGVAINKDSPDPYEDFRRSMQEMIEEKTRQKNRNRKKQDGGEDRKDGRDKDELEYLQELLLCYLNLNPKENHKFIIEAFADIMVSIISSNGGLGKRLASYQQVQS